MWYKHKQLSNVLFNQKSTSPKFITLYKFDSIKFKCKSKYTLIDLLTV